MYKKILSWILTFIMIFSMFGGMNLEVFGQSFNDIEEHWAKANIDEWFQKGLINGYSDGTFKPNGHITRAEFITLINNVINIQQEKEISFKDVKGDEWYYKELQKSMYVEYIKGYDDNTFRANQNITRQEVAVILENLVQLELKEKNSLEKFSDTSNIPAWSRDALQLAVQKGYLAGYKDNSLKASNYITRAESVKVLSNLFGVIYNESGVYGPNDEDILEIDGNVTISVKDVTLQNMIIDGDLYLAEGIGEGDITLDNVTITGETTVKGGGENSIIIKNSSLANLIVIKKGGKIRIILEGNTNIVKTYVRSGVILENKSSNQSSFGDIEIIKIEPSSSVVLNGNFKNINVKATANIKLEKNTILDDLVIGKNISGVFINLLSTSKINNLTINTFIEVTNNGIIIKAVGPYAKDSIYETRLPENLRPAKRTSSSSVTRYTLTLSSNPVGGGALSGAGRYKSGETITVSAITAEGYEFLNWTDNDIEISTSSAFSFNMPPKNKNLTANFEGSGIASDFAGGSGTESDPYQVANAEQLNKVRDYLDAHFIQTADIDLGVSPWNDGEGWDPIGAELEPFNGNYDGGNYTIEGLYINRPEENYQGLFGSFKDGTIENLHMKTVNITGRMLVGSLIGYLNNGDVKNCSSTGTVYATFHTVGGLLGYNYFGSIKESFTEGNVKSDYGTIGGLVGRMYESTVESSFSTSNVLNTEHTDAGGLVGSIDGDNSSVLNSYATGNIDGDRENGGLIGRVIGRNIDIKDNYSIGEVTGNSDNGGLIGKLYEDISIIINNSYYNKETSGQTDTGKGIQKTTTEMKSQSTYENWDFPNIWTINSTDNNGYPALYWQGFHHEGIFAGGSGTEADPYQVANAEQLNKVRDYLDAHFKQISDIDLGVSPWNDGEGWEPIGDDDNRFSGSYNGNSYQIDGLTINRPTQAYIGLFGHTTPTCILSEIKLTSIDIKGNYDVGGLTGENRGKIFKCSAIGQINGDGHIGGLVGYQTFEGNNKVAIIKESFSNVNITATSSYVGGLVGSLNSGAIENSYAVGKVKGQQVVGGLVGQSPFGKIMNSYSIGEVIATEAKGGLIGRIQNVGESEIVNSYWDTETSKLSASAAGTGKTTAEMKNQSTYVDWDFPNIWTINSTDNNGYPALAWQGFDSESDFAGGSGTEGDPYKVETAEQLNNVRDYLDAHFIQIADIDLGVSPWNEDEGWIPIGTESDPFTGSYNGDEHTIQGLYINRPEEEYQGLFGYVNIGAKLVNINLVDSYVYGDRHVGSLAGYSASEISDCSSTNVEILSSWDYVGGLVGQNSGTISNSSTTGTVKTDNEDAGGLVGYNRSNDPNITAQIINCFSEVNVIPITTVSSDGYPYNLGGLVGYNSTNGLIKDSYATGEVIGYEEIGGLVGENRAEIINCYATGDVTGSYEDIGGLVGYNGGEVKNCYAIGSVTGANDTGGLIGDNSGIEATIKNSYHKIGNVSGTSNVGGLVGGNWFGIITESYAEGNVSGNEDLGGLIGYSASGKIKNSYATGNITALSVRDSIGGLIGDAVNTSIVDCYATGNVSGHINVGGLIGGLYKNENLSANVPSVTNCYSTGLVTGNLSVGGLIGAKTAGISVNNSYYDSETSNQSDDSSKGIPKTTTEMKIQSTYVGWDFTNIWNIDEGTSYPYLRNNEQSPHPVPPTP